MKIYFLRWFGHIGKKNSEKFVKKVYVSEIEGPRRRGRPVVRWKDRVKEYIHEKGTDRRGRLKQARADNLDREKCKPFCCEHPFRRSFQRERSIKNNIDR